MPALQSAAVMVSRLELRQYQSPAVSAMQRTEAEKVERMIGLGDGVDQKGERTQGRYQ